MPCKYNEYFVSAPSKAAREPSPHSPFSIYTNLNRRRPRGASQLSRTHSILGSLPDARAQGLLISRDWTLPKKREV